MPKLFRDGAIVVKDRTIARACRKAAKLAKLNYGQANGFTCHSLRHTFVTDMMEATGNDVALIMSYSGHKSIESFKIYLHPTESGRILAKQRMNAVGDFLGTFVGIEGTPGIKGTTPSPPKRLKRKQVVV